MTIPRVALLYDDDAYVEAPRREPSAAGPKVLGIMGRQVAGRGFLDAYLKHGRWEELVALVRHREAASALIERFRAMPGLGNRRLRLVERGRSPAAFFRDSVATVLHTPEPPDSALAWARRQAGPAAFALSGVTHTLSSAAAVARLRELVTAPFEPFDTLICTSTAVLAMVRAVMGSYADYLRERHGASPSMRARLEVIPLGVDTDEFRPPTAAERAEARGRLGLAEDEVAILFVGRLSAHAKAHPYPLYRAAEAAAQATGRAIRLILAGWAAHPMQLRAFEDGARQLAGSVRTTIVDGTEPATRRGVWHAADIFATLADSVQETFGLTVVEAMASGLPLLATDWNGYRDLVIDGQTGFLVPTLMVRGASADATARLLMGAVDYDHFLAECGQSVAVDVASASAALSHLVADEPLRRRLGEAGRARAVEAFAWKAVVYRYEQLWTEQDAERLAVATASPAEGPVLAEPACYPPPEVSFAGYPTRWLDGDDRLVANGSAARLDLLLSWPLTNLVADRRVADPAVLRAVLADASTPRPLAELEGRLRQAGAGAESSRATLAWLLKYELLGVVRDR